MSSRVLLNYYRAEVHAHVFRSDCRLLAETLLAIYGGSQSHLYCFSQIWMCYTHSTPSVRRYMYA
jgi:hypothetical protein